MKNVTVRINTVESVQSTDQYKNLKTNLQL